MEGQVGNNNDHGGTDEQRKDRKEEGKRLKRQRIESSGGTRPRTIPPSSESGLPKNNSKQQQPPSYSRPKPLPNKHTRNDRPAAHKFGRVMDQPPCSGKGRHSTLSIAVPGSIVSNAQTRELKTYLVAQIARAATIYHVDEIVVFDDKLSVDKSRNRSFQRQRTPSTRDKPTTSEAKQDEKTAATEPLEVADRPPPSQTSSDPHLFMARILQYCECPQYLRRNFFPMHPDLQFAGLLPPIDAPHHVRAEDRSKYREGVVMDKTSSRNGNSLVNCGIRNRPVE
jgi:hypothetical protein